MSNKSQSDNVTRCEEWMATFSWTAVRDNKDEVLERFPDVSNIDVQTLTSLFRAFLSRHEVPLTPTAEANGTARDSIYDGRFYDQLCEGSRQSADEIVPYLMELVNPRRVVDVGCGVGTWLAAFVENGLEDVHGIDGSWVKGQRVQIPNNRFLYVDLAYPFEIDDQFDLAVSVEVAEHLPTSSSEAFIASLCRLAPIVCFSAAIPFQGGKTHINEQWPEYWIEKFSRHDYRCLDCLRDHLWKNDKIEAYYAQNMFLFCSREAFASNVRLQKIYQKQIESGCENIHAYVHPKIYLSSILHGLFAGVSIDDLER